MRWIISFALILLPATALAATFSGIALTTSPEVPAPGSPVTVTATVVDRDPFTLEYRWTVDGEETLRGVGQKSITVTAPAVGESLRVRLEASDGNGPYGSNEITLTPSAVYLEWDARTSAPPFYIGRHLSSGQSPVVVTATPYVLKSNGERYSSSELFFEWRVDRKLQGSPVLGRTTVSIDPPFYNRAFVVSVLVYPKNKTAQATALTLITPQAAALVVYETAPLGGILDHRAITDSLSFSTQEVTLSAYPLRAAERSLLNFTWSLNDSPVEVDEQAPHTVTFRKTGDGEGSYTVRAEYVNPQRFLEKAARRFLLQF